MIAIGGRAQRWVWMAAGPLLCLLLAHTVGWRSAQVFPHRVDHGILSATGALAPHFSARGQADVSDRRIGIVYSETSADNFYDEKAYSQLFMAVQHQTMMAGIPFDLLRAETLTDVTTVANYDALVFPAFTQVPLSLLPAVENALRTGIFRYNVGIVAAGEFMTEDERGTPLPGDRYQRMRQLLGLRPAGEGSFRPMQRLRGPILRFIAAACNRLRQLFDHLAWIGDSLYDQLWRLLHSVRETAVGKPTVITATAADTAHPALRGYAPSEVVGEYESSWSPSFEAEPSQPVTVLARQIVGDQVENAVLVTETGGRNVHFASPELMGNSNLVWQALQWVVYGQNPAIALHMGRSSSIFASRCDMDLSQWPSEVSTTETELLGYLQEWKGEYDFVGSFFINIGNDPQANRYTDWDLSGPLYREYLVLGNEIGSHSYTHPFFVTTMTAEELLFEFCVSKKEIESQLDITVSGAALPGNPENLAVTEAISQCLSYVSGSYSGTDGSYASAFGYLTPDYRMVYLAPNLAFDYEIVEGRGWTAQETEVYWLQQYSGLVSHASQPIIHWPWHDYGPTDGSLYSLEMYEHLIERARGDGTEFTTVADLHERINVFGSAALAVSSGGTSVITATVKAQEPDQSFGDFSLKVRPDASQVIQSVDGWYAYDEDAVFLGRDGGTLTIRLGEEQDSLTHIICLPMRAELLSVSGDGVELNFVFRGEGKVVVQLSSLTAAGFSATGADSVAQHGSLLEMGFDEDGLHAASINLLSSSGPQ